MTKTRSRIPNLFVSLSFMLVAAPVFANKIAIAPLENRAGISEGDIDVIEGAIRSAFVGGDAEVVFIEVAPGEACDSVCASIRAKDTGARYLVTGSVSLFGGHFTVQLDAADRISSAIAASITTEPRPTLAEVLPLVQEAGRTLAAKLAAPMAPIVPAPAPVQQPRPRVYASPPNDEASDQSVGPTGTLVVITDPPGARVYLVSTAPVNAGTAAVAGAALGLMGAALVADGSEDQAYLGRTPVQKNLLQGTYELNISKAGYSDVDGVKAVVFPGETTTKNITLRKARPFIVGGGLALGFGVVALIPGIVTCVSAAKSESSSSPDDDNPLKTASIVMLVTGGIGVTVGAILLPIGIRKRQSEQSRFRNMAMLPTPDGFAVAYGQSF